ncbi:hypothetical protein CFC21_008825 [Triticum aestivum]|uniref:Uncharacterized protein n=2 Tax=Triticum aestivum TaxID=4565 RepID=A0A9R1IT16_WHEAT|nr:uncharacterized protein LOC123098194 [Triticum aestivum]KAF6991776.1 hypothetical protein CFC21_008825 [Triticum aestivum]
MANLTGRSMEPPAAAWPPCGFPSDWSIEPLWIPGYPADSAMCFQTHVPSSSSRGQLQQVQYTAATTPNLAIQEDDEEEEAQYKTEMKIHDPIQVFAEAAHEFKVDIDMKNMKIHRYPASIQRLGGYYTTPTTVAIGPYHHRKGRLRQAEKVKHVAAYHCIMESGRSIQEMYAAVASVTDEARRLYHTDMVAGMGDDDFLPMMFYDACFLVQYMLTCTTNGSEMDPSMRNYFDDNNGNIFHDIILLENQLPWRVVKTVMGFRPVSLEEFITSLKDGLQDRKLTEKSLVLDDSYEPPHLLGLLRFYIVGRSNTKRNSLPQTGSMGIPVSAIELAEIGIALTANKTGELIEMGVRNKGTLFAELFLAPMPLDHVRASWLVNMAAFEVCTTPNFQAVDDKESVVCSYLLLLSMFVDREEDVQELRRKRLLLGGGGLANKDALDFLIGLHGLPAGSGYLLTMEEIHNYKAKRRTRTRLHAFVYKNLRIIIAFFSAIGVLVSIFGTLMSLKRRSLP